MSGPKVLLFDLGGVLVEFVGVAEMQRILGAGTIDQLKQRWATSPALARFEVGRCSVDDFAADFVEEWRLKLEPAEFVDQFSSWVRPPAPATLDMLSGLRGRYRLACLSNTNAVHWAQMLDGYGLRHALDRQFASHELGLLKPNPEVYTRVAQELACDPRDIAFFDDSPDNVKGALSAGLSAHLVPGHDQLQPTLARLGYSA